MSAIDRLEGMINRGTDRDWLWWPFLRYRPKRTEPFSLRLVVGLSLIITIVAHGVVILLRVAMHRSVPLHFAVVVTAILFVLACALQSLVAYCWNRRMARLNESANEGA